MWGPTHATRTLCPAGNTTCTQRGEQAQRKPADIHIHQPVMLFRLTRISREPLFVLPVLQLSFLVPIRRRQHRGHRPRNIHHPPARDKPQALSVSIPSLHSAPAPRHPSRGVRPLCSHRATNDMGIPPILAHPHTNPANACAAPSTILAAYIERPAERGCCCAFAYIRLLELVQYELRRVVRT